MSHPIEPPIRPPFPDDRGPDCVEYGPALEAQSVLAGARRDGAVEDLLWLLEHPPTITLGTLGGRRHVLFGDDELTARGIRLVETRRGGDVTCHEPGQLVGYPIVRLSDRDADKDIHLFLRRIEEAWMRVFAESGIEARRVEGRTGVWTGDDPGRKLVALGVRCRGWVTSHGFAANIVNDLTSFDGIVPCGIADAGVTSMARELPAGECPDLLEVGRRIHRALEERFERRLRLLRGDEGLALARQLAGG